MDLRMPAGSSNLACVPRGNRKYAVDETWRACHVILTRSSSEQIFSSWAQEILFLPGGKKFALPIPILTFTVSNAM
jgi:hypothetical protein